MTSTTPTTDPSMAPATVSSCRLLLGGVEGVRNICVARNGNARDALSGCRGLGRCAPGRGGQWGGRGMVRVACATTAGLAGGTGEVKGQVATRGPLGGTSVALREATAIFAGQLHEPHQFPLVSTGSRLRRRSGEGPRALPGPPAATPPGGVWLSLVSCQADAIRCQTRGDWQGNPAVRFSGSAQSRFCGVGVRLQYESLLPWRVDEEPLTYPSAALRPQFLLSILRVVGCQAVAVRVRTQGEWQ